MIQIFLLTLHYAGSWPEIYIDRSLSVGFAKQGSPLILGGGWSCRFCLSETEGNLEVGLYLLFY